MLPQSLFIKPGWCTKEKAERLYRLVRETNADTSLELGILGDISFLAMAIAHKDNKLGSVIKIDPYDKEQPLPSYDNDDPNYQWWFDLSPYGLYNSFVGSIYEYEVCDQIEHYYYDNAIDAIELFQDESIDIIHGCNTCAEVELYHVKVRDGGFWILNDCEWASMNPVQKLLMDKGFQLYEDYVSWKIFIKTS